MSARWKSIVVTVLLAAVASGAGAWAGVNWTAKRHEPASLHEIVHRRLDLTAEQTNRIDAIEEDFAVRRAPLEAQLRQANRRLAAAIAANEGNSAEVQASVDEFHDAMGALQKATIAHAFEMRGVLGPDQARAFDAAVADALLQDSR
ncbi:MAG: periplasmic heavy metal sensor [Brevundimonas sp.]|uniref:Spy/CpxP family protein refolding chaperone n=1 Tax=Brevundimonas sp. TaxID=1871086 RepID=UPI00258E65AE|nr:periplasmic heavy metal sensor [Brevundimonas sp.]MCV0415687.1 periplasmic heavy metal sensor [Brevundimonas sp.]